MKTNELIKTLRFCSDKESVCTACNRYDDMGVDGGTNACMCDLMRQAANAIEDLQTQLKSQKCNRDSENATIAHGVTVQEGTP